MGSKYDGKKIQIFPFSYVSRPRKIINDDIFEIEWTSKIENFEDEKDRIRAEELDASKAVSKAADVKLRLALDNINLLSSLNNGLVENMLALSTGPSKAQGVFGMMGY